MNPKRLFIIAGEHSGDLHGSLLLSHLRALEPTLLVEGIGGPLMRDAGMTGIWPAEDLAVIGFVEVFRNLRRLFQIYFGIRRHLAQHPPDLLILIDYPGFNVRIASMAKRLGIRVLYFILPQVWAWNRRRVPKIAEVIDEAVVVFPFEVEIWRQAGVKVACFGHPLVGVVESRMPPAEFRARHGLLPPAAAIPHGSGGGGIGGGTARGSIAAPVISLLPGSRNQEVHYILPDLLAAGRLLASRRPACRFILPLASTIKAELVRPYLEQAGLPVTLVQGQTYESIAASDLALVASGTATLETAMLGVPMVIVYRTNLLTSIMSMALIDSAHIGLPNVIAGREVVPELVRWRFTPAAVADAALAILDDPAKRQQIADGLAQVRQRLGPPGASQRLARHLHDLLFEFDPGPRR